MTYSTKDTGINAAVYYKNEEKKKKRKKTNTKTARNPKESYI